MTIKRGDVVLINLEPVRGSEQGRTRPCLVIQNNIGNEFSPTTIVAAITSKTEKEYPFTVFVRKGEGNLAENSLVLCNHIRTISIKDRVIKRMGALNPATLKRVDEAIKTSLGLN